MARNTSRTETDDSSAAPLPGTPGGQTGDAGAGVSVDDRAAQAAAEPAGEPTEGVGAYKLAFRRLRRNKVAFLFLALFLLIVIVSVLAPVYSHSIAHIGPNENNITGQIRVNGKLTDVVSPSGVPVGPTYHSRYFFGADNNGRDVAVRLLYGGRNSLYIGVIATAITLLLGVAVGTLAGFFRGVADAILRPAMELVWSFPVVLLGVALGTALALGGIGPIKGNSLYVPAFIIGFIYIPYFGKPVRAEVLRLREQDFVDAARVQGMGPVRIMTSEILPNLASTIVVFAPLLLAQAILLEAYLSFLGAGVQPPNPSWGTLISDGIPQITSAAHLTLMPGAMLVLAVLGVNVFGDGVRDALDPRSQVRVEH
jgi:peptide/nickel transport system permease protein